MIDDFESFNEKHLINHCGCKDLRNKGLLTQLPTIINNVKISQWEIPS